MNRVLHSTYWYLSLFRVDVTLGTRFEVPSPRSPVYVLNPDANVVVVSILFSIIPTYPIYIYIYIYMYIYSVSPLYNPI